MAKFTNLKINTSNVPTIQVLPAKAAKGVKMKSTKSTDTVNGKPGRPKGSVSAATVARRAVAMQVLLDLCRQGEQVKPGMVMQDSRAIEACITRDNVKWAADELITKRRIRNLKGSAIGPAKKQKIVKQDLWIIDDRPMATRVAEQKAEGIESAETILADMPASTPIPEGEPIAIDFRDLLNVQPQS
jgi:hypothetical protein